MCSQDNGAKGISGKLHGGGGTGAGSSWIEIGGYEGVILGRGPVNGPK